MFGGETSARQSSRSGVSCLCKQPGHPGRNMVPEAIVEVVDPMILGSRVQEVCSGVAARRYTAGHPRLLRSSSSSTARASVCSSRLYSSPSRGSSAARSCSSQRSLLHPVLKDVQECSRQLQHRIASCQFLPDRVPMDAFFPSKNDSHPRQRTAAQICAKTAT